LWRAAKTGWGSALPCIIEWDFTRPNIWDRDFIDFDMGAGWISVFGWRALSLPAGVFFAVVNVRMFTGIVRMFGCTSGVWLDLVGTQLRTFFRNSFLANKKNLANLQGEFGGFYKFDILGKF
jgi:hypothetical protein